MKPAPWQGDPPGRESKAIRITAAGCGLDRRATRVTQAEQAGHLVEGFACGIVTTAAQALVITLSAHGDQFGVTAGDQQHQQRQLRRWIPAEG